nr:cation:proton antiporter [Frankia sp. CiP3]
METLPRMSRSTGLLETWRADPGLADWVVFAVRQMAGGLAVGVLAGLAGSRLLMRVNLGPSGAYPVVALGVAGVSYGLAAAIGASGFLAVYVTGLFVGARVPLHRRGIRTFHEGLASTAEVGLFLMLGVLVFPSDLPGVVLPGLVVAAVLVLLARPIAGLVSLVWLGYRWQELAFICWAGLRGAVPIVRGCQNLGRAKNLTGSHADGRAVASFQLTGPGRLFAPHRVLAVALVDRLAALWMVMLALGLRKGRHSGCAGM